MGSHWVISETEEASTRSRATSVEGRGREPVKGSGEKRKHGASHDLEHSSSECERCTVSVRKQGVFRGGEQRVLER
jgi:hypothetical protein